MRRGSRLATKPARRRFATTPITTLLDRVRGEFIEMPGLQLTIPEASRLWGMDVDACQHVVEVLVETSFLRWTPGGKFVRANKN
jgi:hypothetical protein